MWDSRVIKWIRKYFFGFVRIRMDSYGFANPRIHTKRISTLTTRIMDSFRRLNYKLPVSWFGFVEIFLKDSFRGFVSWKNFFKITRFVSFRKDSYTNPASLQKINIFSITSNYFWDASNYLFRFVTLFFPSRHYFPDASQYFWYASYYFSDASLLSRNFRLEIIRKELKPKVLDYIELSDDEGNVCLKH